MRWAFALLVPLLAGCTATNIADLVTALGKDDATVCVRTHVIYGIGNGEHTLYRTKILNGTVKCDKDGLTVTSGAPPPP